MNDQKKLFEAIENKKYDTVKEILTANPELVNAKDQYGNTPLHLAADRGHLNVVKFLIENGADVNAAGKFSRTPLFFAVRRGHLGIVQLLLEEKEINIDLAEVDGTTPLIIACQEETPCETS